jgi:hypothetical protein
MRIYWMLMPLTAATLAAGGGTDQGGAHPNERTKDTFWSNQGDA